MIDSHSIRKNIPALANGVAYLDSASTTLKPQTVIDAMNAYYQEFPANVHRGVYHMSERATAAYEHAREQVQHFVNARFPEEIIFTSGTTESLNMAARMCAQSMRKGDSVLLTYFEHHSNIVPWQLIAQEKGVELLYLPVTENGEIDVEAFDRIIKPNTKILAVTHISNASGIVSPLSQLVAKARAHGMRVIVDGAQSAPHMPIDVQALDVDFFACSAHKMLGPTGVGLLYIRKELHDSIEPVVGGGSMIREVSLHSSTWADAPAKFEAGTPNIAGVIGFGAAVSYLHSFGMDAVNAYITQLSKKLYTTLESLPYIHILGSSSHEHQHGIASFIMDGVHPHDVATILDQEHLAVRAGHHCAQPLMKLWGVPATTRASLYIYNTTEDIERLKYALEKVYSIFHRN
ncbi:MAG: cysteine desulfurase [Candidatus Kerfeldbacteria bacterium]|nr:cysteine desulfurase [Candidatus Kerfeldbacteria bacterium]